MTPAERRRAFIEVGIALGVLIGCVVVGIMLANLPAVDRYGVPDEPVVRQTDAPLPSITRDPFIAVPSPRSSTVVAADEPGPTAHPERSTAAPRDAVARAPQGRPSRGAAPAKPHPTATASAPHTSPSPSGSPSSLPADRPCLVSVLGICVRLG